MNYLLQGDKGYTIPEMFAMLAEANLTFISMTQLKKWDLMSLFKDSAEIPTFLAHSLSESNIENQLHLYELLNSSNRLLDFYCGNKVKSTVIKNPWEWTVDEWKKVKIHLHPQMKNPVVIEELLKCIQEYLYFPISKHLPLTEKNFSVKNNIAACLYPPLLESMQSFEFFVQRWQKLYPENPITKEATTEEQAFKMIKNILIERENFGDILLEFNN